jgi:hypothetical protein
VETDLLAELVDRRHAVLLALRDLTRRQFAHAGAGETTALLGVLASKQSLLEELQATDRRLDPYREQDPEARRWRTPDDRRRCQQAAAGCTALLSEIVLLEERSAADLVRRRDQAAERLQGVHAADTARAAYARPTSTGRSQFDISSES